MVFSESVARPRTGLRAVQLRSVLAVLYAFGGVAALIALFSKLVVMPLHDELSWSRRVLARDARQRVFDLNLALERAVSSVPSTRSVRKGYRDAQSITSRTVRAPQPPNPEAQDWGRFQRVLQSATSPDTEELEKKLIGSLDDTEQYLRSLQYRQIRNFTTFELTQARAAPKHDAVAAMKQEIRSFKGALLSL